MRLTRTDHFKSDFCGLPVPIRRSTEKVLRFFVENLRHPSLRAKKMEGQFDLWGREIWEVRVTKKYRFTFAIDKDADAYILYRVGAHDIERRPY